MRRTYFFGLLPLFLLFITLTALSQDELEPRQGRILFVSDRLSELRYDIYSMNPDGSDQQNLTNTGGSSTDAVWSPDGSQIAFADWREGTGMDIWIMNADGSDPHQVTQLGGDESSPAWSPDGTQIAFYGQPSGGIEIYTINTDGTGLTRLTNSPGNDLDPIWSPDGTRIVFISFRDYAKEQYTVDAKEVYVMNADGSNPINLSNASGRDDYPAWSPDGTQIAFSSERDGNREIYIVNADGTDLRNLSNRPDVDDNFPVWSPDGTRIAFGSEDGPGNPEIFVMDADGSHLFNLTQDPGADGGPSWSPDGTKIAFHSYRDESSGIYIINVDGTHLRRLTFHNGDQRPFWSPGTIGPLDTQQDIPLAEADPCPSDFAGYLPPRLQVDGRGRVLPDQSANRLRISPATNADQIGSIEAGSEFTVVGGPSCDTGNSIIWWHVRSYDGLEGWTAEGLLPDVYFLEPL